MSNFFRKVERNQKRKNGELKNQIAKAEFKKQRAEQRKKREAKNGK